MGRVKFERFGHPSCREHAGGHRFDFLILNALTDQPLYVFDFGRRKIKGAKRYFAVRDAFQITGHAQRIGYRHEHLEIDQPPVFR